jgi:hypothetical protein
MGRCSTCFLDALDWADDDGSADTVTGSGAHPRLSDVMNIALCASEQPRMKMHVGCMICCSARFVHWDMFTQITSYRTSGRYQVPRQTDTLDDLVSASQR